MLRSRPALSEPTRAPRAWRAHPRLLPPLLTGVVAALVLALLHRTPLTAELAILVGLTAYTLFGRRPALAWVWTAWLAAIVALDDLRGLQAVLGSPHGADVAAMEIRLFGRLPAAALQHAWARTSLQPWDVAMAAVYLLHSPAPLLCGAALWRWRRDRFTPFVLAIVAAASAGLVIYLAFPESPPWLLSDQHAVEPVRRLTTEVMAHAGPLSGIYGGADPLPNAAMPSLHAGYAIIVAWFAVAAFGRRALPVVLYPAAMAVAVVYLGEHHVVDVVAGIAVVAGAIATGELLARRLAVMSGSITPGPIHHCRE